MDKNHENVKMSSLTTINESEILQKLYEENYNRNKALTIIIEKTSNYHNVNVKKINISGTHDFQKYIHTAGSTVNQHKNVVLDFSSKSDIKSFNAADYTYEKLEHVALYFHNNDSYNTLPLLIEFKPKGGQQFASNVHDKSVYFQLKNLVEKKIMDEKSEWERTYENVNLVYEASIKIQEIYSGDLKEQIYKIIGTGDNSTLIGAVSGSVGTISAIGTGVGGFFIYKNSAIVISFLKSLF